MTIYKILLLDSSHTEADYPGYYRMSFDTEKDKRIKFPTIPEGISKNLIRYVVLIEDGEEDSVDVQGTMFEFEHMKTIQATAEEMDKDFVVIKSSF